MALSLWLSQVTASSYFPLPSKISSLHCWQKSVGWLMLVLYLYRDHYLSIWVNLLLILLYTWMKHLEQNIFDLENEFFIWFFNYNYLVDYYGIFLGCRYMTEKLLLKLDTIKFIAANHTIISALNYILKKKKTFSTFYLTLYEMNLYTYHSHSCVLISFGLWYFTLPYSNNDCNGNPT